jgi:hypothetical protein
MKTLEDLLRERLEGIELTQCDLANRDQRHLDLGTDERAYWHHGYASALKDAIRILQSTSRQTAN